MSSYALVLHVSLVLFAFATGLTPVVGSPQRIGKGKEAKEAAEATEEVLGSSNPHGVIGYIPFYESQEECLADPLPSDITFYYYTENYPTGKVFDFEAPPKDDFFKSSFTKLITHGVKSTLGSPEMRELVKAYVNRSDQVNVLGMDWSRYTRDMYRESAKSTIKIGKAIASLFCILYKFYDIYPYQMHFIGHNLGAHLLAVTAREAKTKVGRITGLDPARLCFEDQCHGLHYPQLSKSDAKFVDVLHTDPGGMGVANSHGTADFYVNSGRIQPSCHIPYKIVPKSCDSLTSILYFAESVKEPFKYLASACDSPYPALSCSSDSGEYWGEFMGNTARGVYNFYTNATVTH